MEPSVLQGSGCGKTLVGVVSKKLSEEIQCDLVSNARIAPFFQAIAVAGDGR